MSGSPHYRQLSRSEIAALEVKVDAFFSAQSMPGRTVGEARWKLLTAAEDLLRLEFARTAKIWIAHSDFGDRANFTIMLDKYKYWLKYALALIDCANLPQHDIVIERFGEDRSDYSSINDFLHRVANSYSHAVGIFTLIWSEHYSAYGKSNRDLIVVKSSEREIQYRSLEPLVFQEEEHSPLILLGAIFLGPKFVNQDTGETEEWSRELKKLVSSTKLRSRSISYHFVAERGRIFYQNLLHKSGILPESWVFPWGNVEQAASFSCALVSLCFYHLTAIYFGAMKYSLRGVGLNEVGLVLSIDELRRRICAISGLPLTTVGNFIAALTYGQSVVTPDPALQPLIPTGKDQLFTPCMMVITNHWARNMLSLHARVDKTSFDAQSNLFEKKMTSQILEVSSAYTVIPNRVFKHAGWKEELDLTYVDCQAKVLLICELRWSIPPGDPREMVNRKNAVYEKVAQLYRKVEGVRQHLDVVLNQLGIHSSSAEWSVLGQVVIDGYSGVPSQQPRTIPVVPKPVFMVAIKRQIPLKSLHAVFTTPLWLPRDGIDVAIGHSVGHLGSVEIQDIGFSLLRDGYLTKSLPSYLDDALLYSANETRSIVW